MKVILVLPLGVSETYSNNPVPPVRAPLLTDLPGTPGSSRRNFSPASTGTSPITNDKQTCFNNFFWKAKLSDFLKVKMKINLRLYTTLLASKDEIQVQPVTGNALEALPQLPS